MAISERGDGLLLDTWRATTRQNTWYFNQVSGEGTPRFCQYVYIQSDRDALGRVCTDAENELHRVMGYSIRPVWLTEEIPVEYGAGIEGKTFKLSSGRLLNIGKRATTMLEAGAAIVYSDTDGDGINDRATITVDLSPATPPPAEEIEIFFRVADGADSEGSYTYAIKPVNVAVSGSVVTVTAHRSLFVRPSEWQSSYDQLNLTVRTSADTQTSADFVTMVDLMRVYADDTDAVQLIGCGGYGVNVSISVEADIINARDGIIRIHDTDACANNPTSIQVWYRAGFPLADDGSVEGTHALAMTRFAMAKIQPRLLAFCDVAETWYQDNQSTAESFTEQEIKDSFGTKVGELYAFKFASRNKLDNCVKHPLWRRVYE